MSKIINLSELQQYISSFEPVKIKDYTISIEIQDESDFSFSVQLKLKEKDIGQEKLIKFRIALEQHENSVNHLNKPQFQIDYYKREDQTGNRIYFNLNIRDNKHLLDCLKGTLVILKEFLEKFAKKINYPEIVNQILYKEAIELELLKYKPTLIQVLYESYLSEQLIIRIDNEKHSIRTLHNFKKYLNIDEIKPIYLPLLEKIKK